MIRHMIDTTHSGLANAMPAIHALPAGSLVALYDTGSPDIQATARDISSIPTVDHVIMIDQGFTGSPNLNAVVRDCENGAWALSKAVNKQGWNVPRPTLYLGFPDTAQQAHDLGWRGDVWLVHSSRTPPTSPPAVPEGLNVVAQQWDFSHQAFDQSVVFDDTWPLANKPVPVDPPPSIKTEQFSATVPVLVNGMSDAHLPHWFVRRVQLVLNSIFGESLHVDGIYGSLTIAAVEKHGGNPYKIVLPSL